MIWVASTRHDDPRYLQWASHVERSRLERTHRPEDRRRFLVGTGVARRAVSEITGIEPRAVPLDRTCARCGGPHGRPTLVGLEWFLSISHSGELVLVAVTDMAPVGVDIERIDPERFDAVGSMIPEGDRVYLEGLTGSQRIRAGFQNWVRREATLKASGDGLAGPVRELEVGDLSSTDVLIRYPNRHATQMRVNDLKIAPEYSAAVCIDAPAEYAVHLTKVEAEEDSNEL